MSTTAPAFLARPTRHYGNSGGGIVEGDADAEEEGQEGGADAVGGATRGVDGEDDQEGGMQGNLRTG